MAEQRRAWRLPEAGRLLLQKIDQEKQAALEAVARDLGIANIDVDFDGQIFVERPCANTSQNEGGQTETEDG